MILRKIICAGLLIFLACPTICRGAQSSNADTAVVSAGKTESDSPAATGIETKPGSAAAHHDPGTKASKEELLSDLYENLQAMDEDSDLAKMGLKRTQTDDAVEYTLEGKPLKDLDLKTLGELLAKSEQLLNTLNATEAIRQEETRKDIEEMLRTMRQVQDEQNRDRR